MPNYVLETDRLRLREFEPADAEDVREMLADEYAREIFRELRRVRSGIEFHDLARSESPGPDSNRMRAALGEPAVGARHDQFEVPLLAFDAGKSPARDEDRRAVGLIVVGEEASNFDGELIQAKRLHDELDRSVAQIPQ